MTTAPADLKSIPAKRTGRDRFLAACHGLGRGRPPVWLMRQAGRMLPEYRQLREKYSFLELVQTPELAVEVTLQPVRRFGFDAAILFSDILVIAEALGQPYFFRDSGGIGMPFRIETTADIERLTVEGVVERLQYVPTALRELKKVLQGRTALIGFAGSPWTLAGFMLEGGSAPSFDRAKILMKENPRAFVQLMEKLTHAVSIYLQMQIEAGVDALQVFDSHGGLLEPEVFMEGSGRWMGRIIGTLKGLNGQSAPPTVVFSLGTHGNWQDLAGLGAAVLGVDAEVSLPDVRRQVPHGISLQGNLSPAWLLASPEETARETRRILESMKDDPAHIFNLGHGVPPAARLECVSALVETIHSFEEKTP